MSALALLSLVLPLPALFVLHDVEEAVVQHRWMLSHEAALRAQFPRLQPLITHLLQLDTRAFLVAALEEWLLLMGVTAYVLLQAPYATEVWAACFLAFSLHLLVHVGQALLVRGYVPGLVSSLLLLPYAAYGIWSIWLVMSGWSMLFLAGAGWLVLLANLGFSHWIGLKCRRR